MVKKVEEELDEVVRSCPAPRVSEAETWNLIPTMSVGDTIVQSIVYSAKYTVPIAETVCKLVNRRVHKPRLCETEGVAVKTAGADPLIERDQFGAKRPTRIPFSSNLNKNFLCSFRYRRSSFHRNFRKISISKGRRWIWN